MLMSMPLRGSHLSALALAFAPALFPAFASAQTPTWDQLKAVYTVQPLQDSSVKSQDRTATEGTYTEFSFPSDSGDTAYATFVRPNGAGPFPLIVLLHGLGGNRQEMIKKYSPAFLQAGCAVMALDAPHHGDRATPADRETFQKTIMGFVGRKDRSQGLGEYMAQNDPDGKLYGMLSAAIEGGVRDIRRAMDWITTPGHRVDRSHIGAMGISMGSIMSSILSGVDDRIDADMLVIGGDPVLQTVSAMPADKQLTGWAASCSLYLPHSTAHVLMLNGYNDQVVPRADTYRLYESAPGATLVFYDIPADMGSQFGHGISADGFAFGEQWLVNMVKVPKPATRMHATFGGG